MPLPSCMESQANDPYTMHTQSDPPDNLHGVMVPSTLTHYPQSHLPAI